MIKRPWDLIPMVKEIPDLPRYIESTYSGEYVITPISNEISLIHDEAGISHAWKDGTPIEINAVPLRGHVIFVRKGRTYLKEENIRAILRSYFKQLRNYYEQR